MNIEKEVHSHDDGILWLWNAHNKVNKRLSKEPSTDPKFPKIQYPSSDMCGDCSSNNKIKQFNSEPTWKKDVVLEFVKVHYGVNNLFLTSDISEVQSDEKDLSENVRFIRGNQIVKTIGFNLDKFDTSLCLAIYGAGVLILITLYIYILRRRRRIIKHQSHMA